MLHPPNDLARSIPEIATSRVVLVVGKGGVGRTTLTGALALAAARAGRRVLVTEVGDPDGHESALARLFGRATFPATPVDLAEGVRGAVLHAREGHARFLRTVLPVPALVRAAIASKSLARLLDAAPSFNEMGVFYHLLDLMKEERAAGVPAHDLLIVDMPATGHALALTALPEPLLELMPHGPIADAMREGQAILYDARRTAAVVVTLPEVLPVNESLELVAGLRRTRIPVTRVVVNKVQDDELDADELAALAPLLEGRELYGAARVRSTAARARAVERVKAEAGAAISTVPELPLVGRELVERLATMLAPTQGGDA